MAVLKVGSDGKAPAHAKVGDVIETAGGNYKITGGTAGNWTSEKVTGNTASGGTDGGSSGGYNSTGFSGSTSGIQGYNNTQRETLNKMNRNSIAWWDADNAARERLAGENEAHARQLGAAGLPVYKDETGRWYAVSQREIQNPHMNGYLGYDTMLREQNDQAEELYRRMVRQGTDRLNAQRGDVNTLYDDAARQAYISHMQGQRAMPGQLAALGMTGGASESSMLQAQAAYQNNLNSVNTARGKAMNDISTAITDLQNSGDIQTAQAILNNADKSAEVYRTALQADIARYDDLDRWRVQQAMQEAGLTGIYNGEKTLDAQQLAYGQWRDSYNRALLKAAELKNYSVMKEFGWSDEEIRAANAQAASGGHVG